MLSLLLLACQPTDKTPSTGDTAAPTAQDVLHAALQLDLSTLEGQATLDVVRASETDSIRLDIGDLAISEVRLNGEPTDFSTDATALAVPTGPGEQELSFTYTFAPHDEWAGWMPERDITFLWPYFCSNLFPCNPDTADGLSFELEVTGAEATAIYPSEIPADAPPYMLAIAVGEYTETALGTTSSGTSISAWTLPDEEEAMGEGTALLVDTFDYLETTYGPYTFGDHVGSVSVDWDDYGGMEHHPYWHISNLVLRSQEVHTHEAAHGWFGDGVRLACWEDLTLSEGTTSYITARALAAAGGPDLFATYVTELDSVCSASSGANAVAMPSTCGAIDILTDPLWSMVPYMKGACFYQDVAGLIGAEALDAVLADFYQTHVGQAARMSDMVEAIAATLPAEQTEAYEALVTDWLTSLDCPSDYATRCAAR